MKKFISFILAIAAVCASGAIVGCNRGDAIVNYTLSADGTYYIVSSVTGNKRALTEYEIPETYYEAVGDQPLPVKEIADKAFMECRGLRLISLPSGLKSIGNQAFALTSLTEISLPVGLESIGMEAFAMCDCLESVVVPSSVTKLESGSFIYCPKLKRAEVYANVAAIKAGTFANAVAEVGGNIYTDTSLKEVVISSNIKKIESTAFFGNSLTDIYYTGMEEEWEEVTFYTFVQKEQDENSKEDKVEYVEKELKKEDCLSSTVNIHFNYSAQA